MNIIYVVTGTSGEYEQKSETNRYVGINKDKAFDYMPNDEGDTHTVSLEVWVNGIQIEGYGKYINDDGWTLNFDKLADMRTQVKLNRQKLKDVEDELLVLESAIGDTSK